MVQARRAFVANGSTVYIRKLELSRRLVSRTRVARCFNTDHFRSQIMPLMTILVQAMPNTKTSFLFRFPAARPSFSKSTSKHRRGSGPRRRTLLVGRTRRSHLLQWLQLVAFRSLSYARCLPFVGTVQIIVVL